MNATPFRRGALQLNIKTPKLDGGVDRNDSQYTQLVTWCEIKRTELLNCLQFWRVHMLKIRILINGIVSCKKCLCLIAWNIRRRIIIE